MTRIIILLTLFVTAFSPSLTGQPRGEEPILPRGGHVPGELIVRGVSPSTPQEVEAFFQTRDVPVNAIQLTQDGTYFLVRVASSGPGSNTRLDPIRETLVERFVCLGEGNPGEGSVFDIDGLWPNYIHDPEDAFVNNTFEEDLCLSSVEDHTYNPLGACPNLRNLPSPNIGSGQVHVAIMDTGLDLSDFSHLYSDFRTESIVEWHAVQATGYMNYTRGTDNNGHGTAVAALIAYPFYKAGRLSLLHLHSFPILNEEGLGTTAALINALDQAINDEVDIINLSLGFVGADCDEYVSALLAPLFTRAAAADILVFASAGNSGVNLTEHPQYPANNSPSSSRLFTVGASACGDESTWSESNHDVNIVDFTAPGEDIIVPFTRLGCYVKASGTSFATPISVSITAALLSRHPVNQTVCMLERRRTPQNGGSVPGTDESRLGNILYLGSDTPVECSPNIEGKPLSNNSGGNTAFPNPVHSVLNIPITEGEMAANATIQLSDLSGRKLFQSQARNPLVKVSMEEMPAGLYILSITNGENVRVTKIIKR